MTVSDSPTKPSREKNIQSVLTSVRKVRRLIRVEKSKRWPNSNRKHKHHNTKNRPRKTDLYISGILFLQGKTTYEQPAALLPLLRTLSL